MFISFKSYLLEYDTYNSHGYWYNTHTQELHKCRDEKNHDFSDTHDHWMRTNKDKLHKSHEKGRNHPFKHNIRVIHGVRDNIIGFTGNHMGGSFLAHAQRAALKVPNLSKGAFVHLEVRPDNEDGIGKYNIRTNMDDFMSHNNIHKLKRTAQGDY